MRGSRHLRLFVLELADISEDDRGIEIPLNKCLFEWLDLGTKKMLELEVKFIILFQNCQPPPSQLYSLSLVYKGLKRIRTPLYHLQDQQRTVSSRTSSRNAQLRRAHVLDEVFKSDTHGMVGDGSEDVIKLVDWWLAEI